MSRNEERRPARRNVPDHGENFVPGAESAPTNTAPQILDHFKRGYRERAHLRDRDTSSLHEDFRRSGRGSQGNSDRFQPRHSGGRHGGRGGHHNSRGGGFYERKSSGRDRGDDRRGQIIMGLDVQALVDRLCRNSNEIFKELDAAREENMAVFQSGKAITGIISNFARRRNLRLALTVWDWIDSVGIQRNTFHYNSLISVCEKVRDYRKALQLLNEMKAKNVAKNEVTFSSAISACEKCGQWRTALDLLEQMKKEGQGKTAIAYNAAISACEKGLVPHKALEIFEQMKREGVKPTVVTYSALISAAEKGQQWKLALEVLEEMKAAGHGANVIAYSAAISALSKGQMWHKALELFREIEASGGKPSIVTYNATITALEKGLQWERALDLFDEMKLKNMPITVVSYGSAISACEKGLQYRQCLEYLDEMTQMGIKKNVIIFGAAMSCMEKSCRADIAFQLMERMKHEDVTPNVHIYNSAISACARCNLWEKGYELFQEMDKVGVKRDVVTYNAVLDAVSSQIALGRGLFKEGVEKGFYARVSRLGKEWLELDLHFLSLGGGEIALGWWFEDCLVPYLINTSRLEAVQSISIVTGYGKTRSRGARVNDDGMRLRVKAMLQFMNIEETPQPNKGRIHINKAALVSEVRKNDGKINFDLEGYIRWKEKETTANKFPDVPQQVRARFRPAQPNEGPPGTFVREVSAEVNVGLDHLEFNRADLKRENESFAPERRDSRRGPGFDDRNGNGHHRSNDGWSQGRGGSYSDRQDDGRLGHGKDNRDSGGHADHRVGGVDQPPRRSGYGEPPKRSYGERNSYDEPAQRRSHDEQGKRGGGFEQHSNYERDWDNRNAQDRRGSRDYDGRGDRFREEGGRRISDSRSNGNRDSSSHFGDNRRGDDGDNRYGAGHNDNNSSHQRHGGVRERDRRTRDSGFGDSGRHGGGSRYSNELRDNHFGGNRGEASTTGGHRHKGNDDHDVRQTSSRDFDSDRYRGEDQSDRKKRPFEHPPNRGYDIEPAFSKRRTSS
ncbi:unnamed protein product [Cylindrotheca closterium]|uniref:Pentacotripeptide-repeat region of PRORP domain-containing protein n=1 Tax=Cylindrotheca closterium TaxID=2856 RepID=A0AAD2CG81_9STRA|nr:unnamed protein product [Cylindrotheca closterium]